MTGNTDQAEFWASQSGRKWVTHADRMDRVLAPVLAAVLTAAELRKGDAVLDIGCGTGASCRAAAAQVGGFGRVLGVDIAPPLLALAKQRSAKLSHVEYRRADAAEAPLGARQFEAMISRFGVMFFADSSAAFANIAKALKPGGRVAFATWGAIEANPWFTDPAQVAKSVLGAPPKTDPDAPGPFALRDIGKTQEMLARAGLIDVQGRALTLALPAGKDAADAADLASYIGPAARTLEHFSASPEQSAEVQTALAARWAAYDAGNGPAVPAQINIFTARAG
ncbi:MAG: class I SAM-dependent methyltransferase [Sulfitobacter sp.]